MFHAEIYFAHSENNDGQWLPAVLRSDAPAEVKIKNPPNYSQAAGRREFFYARVRRKPATRLGKTQLSLGENVG